MLGSGLAGLLSHVEIIERMPAPELGLPVSTVPGHRGELVLAAAGTMRCAILSGRVHLYEGRSEQEVTAGIRLLTALGVKLVILTNAAGSLNPSFEPGTWMMISDHLNLTGASPLIGPHFLDLSEVYSARLRRCFAAAAERHGIPLHEGVYAGLRGPQYETPAEIRMLRTLGADAVGMSTVLEAIQARALEAEVAGFSCLTNWAAGLSGALSHEEVLRTGQAAAESLITLLLRGLADLHGPGHSPGAGAKPG